MIRWPKPLLLAATMMWAMAMPAESTVAQVSAADFRTSVEQMRTLVDLCTNAAVNCDASKVVSDQQVGDKQEHGSFAISWEWLRAAVRDSKSGRPDQRAELMRLSRIHLDELAAEIASEPQVSQSADARAKDARTKTDAILATPEFAWAKGGLSAWDRFMARVSYWLGKFFNKITVPTVPGLGLLLEFGLLLSAAGGLVYFVMRSFSQQRVRVSMSGSATLTNAWQIESADWAALAETCAANGQWREAVHGLYWAAIILLESRRAWRHNPSRTPREYVRLLKPGSVQRDSLRGLTRIFERVWYGLEDADSDEYTRARALFNGLTVSGDAPEKTGEPA